MDRGKRASGGDPISLYIALAVPAIILIVWIMTFWFILQSPIVSTTDIDVYFEDLYSPPELPIEEPFDEVEP